MIKFLVGFLMGGMMVYYAGHRDLKTEAKIKAEVTRRAPMITSFNK